MLRHRLPKNTPLLQQAWIHLNFLRVVLPQFKVSIAVFVVANLIGGLVLWTDPAMKAQSGEPLTYVHATYTALALNFFEVSARFPQEGRLLTQVFYFLLPAVGLLVIAEGILRLGVVILSRKRMSEEWHMALAGTFKNHVIVAGLGKIGGRVAANLDADEHLVCIEAEKDKAALAKLSENVAILIGDAASPQMLAKANVEKARAILVLTDNDLANLEIALNARAVNPQIRVVLRMFNESLGQRLVDTFGFQAVYSTSSLAAPSFSSALYSSKILQTIQLGDDKRVHMARLEVRSGSKLVGQTILQVEEAANVSVVLHHTQGKKELLPSVQAPVRAGDELFVLAELSGIELCDRMSLGDG